MTPETEIPVSHPRAASLKLRERLIYAWKEGIVADAGLLAHGRGEAFDYILGERTTPEARKALNASAAMLRRSKASVISVNGNSAALVGQEIVELAETVGAKIEVNLFYRSDERVARIVRLLKSYGASDVLGTEVRTFSRIPKLASQRAQVDSRGIMVADTVLVPLEDGDRTEVLTGMGKNVIAIDLNPLSRTSTRASVTIVDNVVRAMPLLISEARRLSDKSAAELNSIIENFDNKMNLARSVESIARRLEDFQRNGDPLEVP